MSVSASSPIGVFDSGLGGLTVIRRIRTLLPEESLLFLADQCHVPYGGRDLNEVRSFACGISEVLFEAGCKAVVMACNISSAIALEAVRQNHPEQIVLGVILPGAMEALAQSPNGRLGILATEGTVKSGAYTRALQAGAEQHGREIAVTEVACPQFVPLVESGQTESPAAFAAARDYLAPLCAADADTVILGCTHYPFLLPILRQLAPALHFVDPAKATALLLAHHLTQSGLQNTEAVPSLYLGTTGDSDVFAAQLHRFLPDLPETARLFSALWQGTKLFLP